MGSASPAVDDLGQRPFEDHADDVEDLDRPDEVRDARSIAGPTDEISEWDIDAPGIADVVGLRVVEGHVHEEISDGRLGDRRDDRDESLGASSRVGGLIGTLPGLSGSAGTSDGSDVHAAPRIPVKRPPSKPT